MEAARKSKTRKSDRKQRKCQHIVQKETGVHFSTTPSTNLAICNAGLVNGLSEEIIFEYFEPYGGLDSIVMLPGKSCCFVSFKKLASAVNAYQNINGKLNIAQDQKPVYLSYMKEMPQSYYRENLSKKPPGLIVLENFITEAEEQMLLSLNNFDIDCAVLKHRQVKHYGYEFSYDTNNVDKKSPLQEIIPRECDYLWSRLSSLNLHEANNFEPDQLTVNHYKSGQGIPQHVDTHSAFENPLISLSLGANIIMNFKNDEGVHYPVLLPQRSLTIMSGESRYSWTHGITPRKTDIIPSNFGLTAVKRSPRTSFTFRKLRLGECTCIYKKNCDSYLAHRKKEVFENRIASQLEVSHVHSVYENIALHFSDTRHKPWPNVLNFVESLPLGSVLIDIGCGNGKYLDLNDDVFLVGCDRSSGLLEVCRSRGFQVFNCDCIRVSVRNDVADGVISVAVIHHLANEERRLQAIKEMVRILRTHGKGLIYVWAKDQHKNHEKSSYIKQDRKNRKLSAEQKEQSSDLISVASGLSLPVHTNRTQFQHQDLLVPWILKDGKGNEEKTKESTYLRFYHVFEEGELETLCRKIRNLEIINSYYDQGNWCIIFEKIL